MTHTAHLCQSNLFQKRSEVLSRDARAILSYDRAKAIGLAFSTSATAPSFTEGISSQVFTAGISLHDILHLTQKFLDIHVDPIVSLDGGASTLLTIQYNLAAGTLARFATTTRPELVSLVEDLLQWNVM